MATSVVEIWNLALVRLGHRVVASESESSPEARILNILYPNARDRMLAGYDWQFARGTVELETLPEAEVDDGWMYAYRWPVPNALAFRRILNPVRDDGKLIPFEITLRTADADPTTQKILTDVADARGRYTRQIVEVHRFDPMFVNALSWELQSELVMSLTKNARGMQAAKQYAAIAEGIARQHSASEQVPRDVTPELIKARA